MEGMTKLIAQQHLLTSNLDAGKQTIRLSLNRALSWGLGLLLDDIITDKKTFDCCSVDIWNLKC